MNTHLIVGEGRRCICGVYGDKAVGCAQVLKILTQMRDFATAEQNPSLYIPKGGSPGPIAPTASDLLLLCEVLKPLEQECDERNIHGA